MLGVKNLLYPVKSLWGVGLLKIFSNVKSALRHPNQVKYLRPQNSIKNTLLWRDGQTCNNSFVREKYIFKPSLNICFGLQFR